ncbi:MAG: HIT family protein [Spartobacteria bacterium]|nr:HIT family protein [Spartobacteria bacterium]
MDQNACIFCNIAAGMIPCTKVFESDDILAFMDIGPIIKGHVLVIPKKHYDPIIATPDDVLAAMMSVVKRVASAQIKQLGAQGVNVIQNNGACSGQAVPHIHIHVIPRYEDDGHHWNWDAKSYESMDEMQQLADRISAELL